MEYGSSHVVGRQPGVRAMAFDVVIRNGVVVDGTGMPALPC